MAERRVIFVNRVYWPSGEATAQLLTDLAEGLTARGWPVHVVAAGEAATVREGVTIHRTGTPDHHGGLVSRLTAYRAFLHAVRRQLPALARPGDVVVALTDPPMLGTVVAETLAAHGVPVVQWIQDIYPEIATEHFGPVAGLLLHRLRRRRDRAWSRSAACVTLGPDMAQALAGMGVATDRIALIPNWAPRELAAPPAADSVIAYRKQWKADNRFIVAYSGNFGRVHEFATILAAAEQLKADANIGFRLVGRGAQWSKVAAAVHRRGLTNVELQPAVPRAELGTLLAAADAHLVTLQLAYGRLVYPSKLAGVLAAGRPVLFVGPPEGDIARLVPTRDCGAAFSPGEADSLANTIRRWASDPGTVGRLGTHARQAYTSQFDHSAALAQWSNLLRTLPSPA